MPKQLLHQLELKAQSQVTPAGQILSDMGPPSNFLTFITSAQSSKAKYHLLGKF